jgi:Flp pilus assembly protein TadG
MMSTSAQDLFTKDRPATIRKSILRLLFDCAKNNRGVAAVEFSIFAPVFMLMAVVSADLAFGIYAKMRVENAAQFGSQYAAAYGIDDAAAITNAVLGYSNIAGLSVTPQPFYGCPSGTGIIQTSSTSTCPDGPVGYYLRVSTQGTYKTILPYPVVPDRYTFTTQATVQLW